jgi:hypothetical protein
LQALAQQVTALKVDVAQLRLAEQQRAARRSWLPSLPETLSTRQALLLSALTASAAAGAALAWSRRQHATQQQW